MNTTRPSTRDAVGTRSSNRELWSGIVRGFVAVVAVLAVTVAAAAFIVPRFMGWVPLTILSGSMEPTYSPGDVVVVDPDYTDPVVGDVVTIQPVSGDPTLVTHRIIGVTIGQDGTMGVTTQGDANGSVDDPVTMEQIQGRVIYGVPWVGHLTQPEVRPWLGGAAIAVLAWIVLSSVLGGRKKGDDDAELGTPAPGPADDAGTDDRGEDDAPAPSADASDEPDDAPAPGADTSDDLTGTATPAGNSPLPSTSRRSRRRTEAVTT
ncbi:signal peptidase I [Georgenia sp. Z1344]|uniref:signal peptidase I n=1 Tax=Georgenia sp. Z1344 TaxID=3416706 RepID=UPI003CEF0255